MLFVKLTLLEAGHIHDTLEEIGPESPSLCEARAESLELLNAAIDNAEEEEIRDR